MSLWVNRCSLEAARSGRCDSERARAISACPRKQRPLSLLDLDPATDPLLFSGHLATRLPGRVAAMGYPFLASPTAGSRAGARSSGAGASGLVPRPGVRGRAPHLRHLHRAGIPSAGESGYPRDGLSARAAMAFGSGHRGLPRLGRAAESAHRAGPRTRPCEQFKGAIKRELSSAARRNVGLAG